MGKRKPLLSVYGASGLLLLGASLPAQAVDLVPFAGFRFGGDVGSQQVGTTAPTSTTLDASASFGGIIDIPLSPPRAAEVYYSRQQTKLSGGASSVDVTMSVLHVGLVDTLPSADQNLSWFLAGTLGATQLESHGGSATRPSIGLGGGFVWMASDHIGLRGDLRALVTFAGSGGGSVACGGGCSVSFHGSVVAQGELSLGLVARF